GLCDNRRTVAMHDAEERVWQAIEQLESPAIVEQHVRELLSYWREQRAAEAQQRGPIERKLSGVQREIKKLVDGLLAEESGSRALRERLRELERTRDEFEAALAAVPAPAFDLHPNIAEHFHRKLAELKRAFGWLAGGRGTLRRTFESLDAEGRVE